MPGLGSNTLFVLILEIHSKFCSQSYKIYLHFDSLIFTAELQNVKSFTQTNIVKPDFTPRKVHKLRHFQHFKPTKQNL